MSYDNPEMLLAKAAQPCVVCGYPCALIHYDFEAYVHPGSCLRQLWREYAIATAKAKHLPSLVEMGADLDIFDPDGTVPDGPIEYRTVREDGGA